MKKAWLFLLLSSPAWAAAPKVVFDRTVHDFGTLVQGTTVQYSFSFRNEGDAALEISSVNTSCGCTAALASDRLVAPGKKGRVDVTFDSTGRPGETDKRIRVWTNDPASPLVVLAIKGRVLSSAAQDPAKLLPAKECADDAPCTGDPASPGAP